MWELGFGVRCSGPASSDLQRQGRDEVVVKAKIQKRVPPTPSNQEELGDKNYMGFSSMALHCILS